MKKVKCYKNNFNALIFIEGKKILSQEESANFMEKIRLSQEGSLKINFPRNVLVIKKSGKPKMYLFPLSDTEVFEKFNGLNF